MDLKSRSIASSLAFSAFSTTLFIYSLTITGILGNSNTSTLIPMVLFYGGLILLLAGMVSFKGRDIFTATTALSYAGFWITIGFMSFLQHRSPSSNTDIGVFFLAWSVFTLYVWIGSWKRGGVINLHYLLWLIALILLFINGFMGGETLKIIGGWFAFASSLVGWYIASAKLFEETFGESIFKLGKNS